MVIEKDNQTQQTVNDIFFILNINANAFIKMFLFKFILSILTLKVTPKN